VGCHKLVSELSSGLDSIGAEWAPCLGVRSCFDIAARTKTPFLLKALGNIDSLSPKSAAELSGISFLLGGTAIVVGTHANCYRMRKDVLYFRHGIWCATGATALSLMEGKPPKLEKFKKAKVRICGPALKSARKRSGFSVQKLASLLGISRQTLYRYEAELIGASQENASAIEGVLGSLPLSQAHCIPSPHAKTFKFMQMDAVRVGSPFEIFAKESRVSLMVSSFSDVREAKKRSGAYSQIAPVMRSLPLFLTEKKQGDSFFGIAQVSKSELSKLGSKQELISLVRSRGKN
jgi:putative transcriptional regulator